MKLHWRQTVLPDDVLLGRLLAGAAGKSAAVS